MKQYHIDNAEFRKYGRVLNFDTSEIVSAAEKIPMPESGSKYEPETEAFHGLPILEEIAECFGGLPAQTGFCWGYNNRLSALEWHTCSEINIAVTDLVLMLGTRQEFLSDGSYDTKNVKAFFVPKGAAIEVYATTLHFCPCQIENTGFRCVVSLIQGTNTPLLKPSEDKRLFCVNKWLICRKDNEALISRGADPALF